jgi:redox-sensitive bicupin YhaK (pirin superfamily)
MIDVRPFAGLAHRDHGWLDTRYHFSFSDYHDPDRMGWGKIRVWNDDKIGPKAGFPPHGHNDMEIITFVRTGAVSHKDSLGNEGRTGAGDVQVMSAGKGVVHAEYNLEDEDTTLFQIWIIPDSTGGEPDWGMREFPRGERAGAWEVLASGDPEADKALPLRSDAKILAATLAAGERVTYDAAPWRHQYLVPATGSIRVNGAEARTRDGVAITGEEAIEIEALEDTELVMVDAR